MLPISGISLFVQYTVMLHRVRRVNEATRGRRERTYTRTVAEWPEGPQCAPQQLQQLQHGPHPPGRLPRHATNRTAIPASCSPSCSPYPLSRPSGPSCSRCSHKNIVQLPRHRHSERLECRRARSRAPHHRRRMARSETRTTAQISRSSRAAGQAIQKGGAEEGRDESQWRVADDVSS